MDERRAMTRERVIYGATAEAISGLTYPCVVRNFSNQGAQVVFDQIAVLPDDIALTIARKGRSYQARVVWWRDNTAGLSFAGDAPSAARPHLQLQERLWISEKKTRQLKRRIRELTGHD